MNKYYSRLLLMAVSVLLLNSCLKEEDDIFGKSAAERLDGAKAEYSQRVVSSPAGWAWEYFPTTEATEEPYINCVGYLMLAQFNADGSVRIGMNNAFSGNVYTEDTSPWEIITDNGPVLSFNNKNICLHAFSVPEDLRMTSDDETGKGLLGDYEFIMVDIPESGQYMMLKGKKHGAYSRLTPLSAGTDFAEYIAASDAMRRQVFSTTAPNYSVLTIGDLAYNMINPQAAIGGDLGYAKLWKAGTDSTFTKEFHPFIITRHVSEAGDTLFTMRFREAIGEGDNKVQELTYDAGGDYFYDAAQPEVTLKGEDPFFFASDMLPRGCKFQSTRALASSGAFTTAIEGLNDEYKSRSFTFQNIQLLQKAAYPGGLGVDTLQLVINYRPSKGSAANVRYDYAMTMADGKMTLNYLAPFNASAVNQYDALESIRQLVALLSSAPLEISSTGNNFNLSNVRFSLSGRADDWCTFSYIRP